MFVIPHTKNDSVKSSVLPRPTLKKNRNFPKTYPFPIIRDESEERSQWNCFIGHLKEHCVEVTDEEGIKILFTMGFYGRGTLSRRIPKAVQESLNAQKSNESENIEPDFEIVVCDEDTQESATKRRKTHNEIEVVLSDSNEESVDSTVNNIESNSHPTASAPKQKCDEKEALQLTFEEAFFLSYGFGCLVVKDKDQPLDLMRLWYRFCELHPAQNFPVMYTAYHHFRSKGWIVRSGLLYGVDYVLYKDGPPFYHASYAVVVKAVKDQQLREITFNTRPAFSWASLLGLNRLCNQVGKTLMILYVIKPSTISENKISTPFCVSQFKLQEVIVKRWVPSENRDDDECDS